MAANTATLKINVKVNDDGTVKVLNSVGSASKKAGDTGTKSFNQMNSSAKSLQGQLIKLGAAAGDLYAIKKAMDFSMETIALASDLEETQGKFDVVFRGMTESAEAWSKNMQKSYAMSQTESKRYLSSIQDLIVPTGMAREEAGKLSNEFVKMAADLGSFNNRETADVIMDIQSALQGSSETMAKYGINVKAAKVEQEILNQGWVMSKKDITDAHKAQAIYNIMLRDGADAVGDMARTSDSYANQLKKAKANVDDLKTAIGKGLLPVVTDIVTQFNEWIKANEGLMKTEMKGYIDGLKDSISAVYDIYKSIPSGIIGPTGVGIVGTMLFGPQVGGTIALTGIMVEQVKKLLAPLEDFRQANNQISDNAGLMGGTSTLEPEKPWFVDEDAYDQAQLQEFLNTFKNGLQVIGPEIDLTADATENLIKTFSPMPDLMKKTGEEAQKVVKIIGTKEGLLEKWVNADPDDVVEPVKKAAEEIETIWENTRDTVQNAIGGFFGDAVKRELSGFEDYFTSFADSLTDIWAAHFAEQIMKNGLADGLQNMLSGDMLGLTGAVGALQIGANLLFGDDAPSYFDTLSDKIGDLIDQLAENTQALKDGLFGISEFTTIIRDAKTSILTDELSGMGSLTDELNLPGGMKQRKTPWYQSGAMAYATDALTNFIFIPGIGYLAGEMLKKDKGYTAYDMSGEQLSDTMTVLFDSLNLAELFDLFKQSSTDAGALMDMLMDKNLLNPEIPTRVIDWYSDSGGSKNIEKVSEGITAVLEEAVLNVLTTAKSLIESTNSYVTGYDYSNMTAYALAMKNINLSIDTFKEQADAAIPILQTMIVSENISLENKEKAQEQLRALSDAHGDYARILADTKKEYEDAQQATLSDMTADITALTDPLSAIGQTFESIASQAETYRLELIDNGMAAETAAQKTAEYTAAMKTAYSDTVTTDMMETFSAVTSGATAYQQSLDEIRDRYADHRDNLDEMGRLYDDNGNLTNVAAEGLAAFNMEIQTLTSDLLNSIAKQRASVLDNDAYLASYYQSTYGAVPGSETIAELWSEFVSGSDTDILNRAESLGVDPTTYISDLTTAYDYYFAAVDDGTDALESATSASDDYTSALQDQADALSDVISVFASAQNVLERIYGGDTGSGTSYEWMQNTYDEKRTAAFSDNAAQETIRDFIDFAGNSYLDFMNNSGRNWGEEDVVADMLAIQDAIAPDKTLADLYDQLEILNAYQDSISTSSSSTSENTGSTVTSVDTGFEALSLSMAGYLADTGRADDVARTSAANDAEGGGLSQSTMSSLMSAAFADNTQMGAFVDANFSLFAGQNATLEFMEFAQWLAAMPDVSMSDKTTAMNAYYDAMEIPRYETGGEFIAGDGGMPEIVSINAGSRASIASGGETVKIITEAVSQAVGAVLGSQGGSDGNITIEIPLILNGRELKREVVEINKNDPEMQRYYKKLIRSAA